MAPDRKQVKKFLKPKVAGGSEEAPAQSNRIGYVLALGAVAMVGAAVYLLPHHSEPIAAKVTHTPPKEAPTVDSSKPSIDRRVPDPVNAKKSKVPSYDEYVKQAEEKMWLPTDPVKKLESSILKHKQFIDMVNRADNEDEIKQFMSMVTQEMQYVLAVLVAATDRIIDLTPALHHAIDVIPDIGYSIMKFQLFKGVSKQTGRTYMDDPKHWRYNPITELAKLMAARPAHIVMDVNAPGMGDAILVKVVKHRIYPILSAFAQLGASSTTIYEAMRAAVIQSDDIAFIIISNIITAPATPKFPNHAEFVGQVAARLPELFALAEKLGYVHLAGRIRGVVDRLAGNATDAPGVVPADKVDIFQEYFPYRRVPLVPSEPVSFHNGAVDPLTGYSNFQLDPIHSVASNGFDSYINQCAVDRVDIADLTTGRFYAEYVTLNRPVIITHTRTENTNDDSSSKDPARVWTAENLLKRFGSTQEVSSTIPYATLFGHKEGLVTLNDFVAHPSTGMRAYTRRLEEAVGQQGTTLSEQQLLEVAASVGLPQYIFSGVQQNMNKALSKHMLKTVQGFTAVSSDAENRLLELMHAVSRGGYNVTAPSDAGKKTQKLLKDFKNNWKSQFYLGPALSGAPFHNHGPAFNLLVHGKKEWTLMPPGRDLYSNLHPVEWLREGGTSASTYLYHKDAPPAVTQGSAAGGLRTDQPCKLVQGPGEVLYVPRHWTHQILNLAESVGFAVEIDDYVA